jgi:hypothetical protein
VPYFEQGSALANAVRGNRAGASVVAKLRPSYQQNHEHQLLCIHLVECSGEDAASFLLERSLTNGLGQASVGLKNGSLLCIVVAIPPTETAKYETSQTLNRFVEPTASILQIADRQL